MNAQLQETGNVYKWARCNNAICVRQKMQRTVSTKLQRHHSRNEKIMDITLALQHIKAPRDRPTGKQNRQVQSNTFSVLEHSIIWKGYKSICYITAMLKLKHTTVNAVSFFIWRNTMKHCHCQVQMLVINWQASNTVQTHSSKHLWH